MKWLAACAMLALVLLFAGMFMALMIFAGEASWVMEGIAPSPGKVTLLKNCAAFFYWALSDWDPMYFCTWRALRSKNQALGPSSLGKPRKTCHLVASQLPVCRVIFGYLGCCLRRSDLRNLSNPLVCDF